MPIKFEPCYSITPEIAKYLLEIESVKERISHLPLTPKVIASLRETARLLTTHYSTMIEGNQLDAHQIEEILHHKGHFPGREREEKEIKGYYKALAEVEKWIRKKEPITESSIKTIHALVMSNGSSKVKPTPYRDGQNVIRDSRTHRIVYMPPEAKDVPVLMKSFVGWLNQNKEILPCPLMAAIAHYQFATIHPYYDGNGRTARLLTTWILHQGGYDLRGIYSLEEYYALQLDEYYSALSIGPSHNYYVGRAEADITHWIGYFIKGMARSFQKVFSQMKKAEKEGKIDKSGAFRSLDPQQRRVLHLFQSYEVVTARQIGELLGYKPRTSAQLCKDWVESGFLVTVDFSNKGRKYRLAKKYTPLL